MGSPPGRPCSYCDYCADADDMHAGRSSRSRSPRHGRRRSYHADAEDDRDQ